jgi:hypothetical protein
VWSPPRILSNRLPSIRYQIDLLVVSLFYNFLLSLWTWFWFNWIHWWIKLLFLFFEWFSCVCIYVIGKEQHRRKHLCPFLFDWLFQCHKAKFVSINQFANQSCIHTMF